MGTDPNIERAAQALQDHMEQHYGVCLKASEWDAATRAALEAAGTKRTLTVAETEARIVEWLRSFQHRRPPETLFNAAAIIADRIARRDHITGEKDRG